MGKKLLKLCEIRLDLNIIVWNYPNSIDTFTFINF